MARLQKKPTIEQRVEDFLREHHLTNPRKPLLVAVSGGPDSVCLLRVLNTLKKDSGFKLHVAHLDHKLRGNDSVADAQYVLGLCHKLGIPITIEQRNVRTYQKGHKLSLEEAAREVRYGFFAEVAESIGAERVVVGHTLDDHVETLLLNLLRGTGTRGLRGLQPVRHWQTSGKRLTIIRPLMEVSRKETAAYCRRHRLQPRTDATNRSLTPTRNRVRLKLLPLLKSYNPDIIEALLRTARIAGDDIAFLEQTAARYYRKIANRQGEIVVLDKTALLKLPPSIQRLVLRRAIENILGTLKDIEARHIEEMMVLLKKPAGKRINLPYGLSFAVEYDRFLLGRELDKVPALPLLDGQCCLNVPGATEVPGWRIHTDVIEKMESVGDDNLTACFDHDQVIGKLVVRPRRPGDRFQPLGMDEEKKVGRFMIDARVPRLWRTRIPIVCDEEKLLWVVGYRIDERVKVTEKTKRVLRIRFERIRH
ncbi:MAG TPA: tRNA lysidine(34) synthetase TilS [Dehalococcoidales bacterium]